MSYEKKFRESVLRHVEAGHSQEATRKLFGLGVNTITQWKRLKEETGRLANRPLNRSWKKIDPDTLRADVENHPDDFNRERAERFECSESAIRQALARLKITRKKNERIQGAQPREKGGVSGGDRTDSQE
jgi:transposase